MGKSNNSCQDIKLLFQIIFPDSNITSKFQMGPKKLACIKNFGLSPYCKTLLDEEVKKADWYVALFYESLNKMLQTNQMDIRLRCWNSDTKVDVCFWNSKYLKHVAAQHIFQYFCSALHNFNSNKMNVHGLI